MNKVVYKKPSGDLKLGVWLKPGDNVLNDKQLETLKSHPGLSWYLEKEIIKILEEPAIRQQRTRKTASKEQITTPTGDNNG